MYSIKPVINNTKFLFVFCYFLFLRIRRITATVITLHKHLIANKLLFSKVYFFFS